MIIWVNGPFGGGKSTVAAELLTCVPNSILFDAEEVGFMVRAIFPGREADFQDLPPWRPLVAATAAEVISYTSQTLIAPMSLLRKEYADEIFTAITKRHIAIHHVVLHADADTITRRILADHHHTGSVRQFRLSKIDAYQNAFSTWLFSADDVIDTGSLEPAEIADRIANRLQSALPTYQN